MVKVDSRQKRDEKRVATKAKNKKFNLGNESQEKRFFSSKRENYQPFRFRFHENENKIYEIICILKYKEIIRKYINKLYKKS